MTIVTCPVGGISARRIQAIRYWWDRIALVIKCTLWAPGLVEILGHSPDELLIKTISVQTEIALIYLYRMAAFRILQKPINAVVARLLRPEYASLQRQVDEFKAEARFS